MNNLVTVEVTAAAETALKKLSGAEIPVYNLKKRGAKLAFSVNREYVKKVFAIFKHPCYNINVVRASFLKRATDFVKRRSAVAVCIALFFAGCYLSQGVILKIKVTGNADYLSAEAEAIAQDFGVKRFAPCSGIDKVALQATLLSLEGVNFCSVTCRGSFVVIELRASDNTRNAASYDFLKAPRAGTVKKIVAVCGTPLKEVGLEVAAGEELIAPYEENADGERISCMAVGYVKIEAEGQMQLFYSEENAVNTAAALASPKVYSEEITSVSYKVSATDGGVYYTVDFKFIVTASLNME